MSLHRWTTAAATVALAACGGAAGLEARVVALEQRVAGADAEQQRLLAALRDHGITVHVAPPRDAAEAAARALDDLDAALARLLTAKQTQDEEQGRSALAAVERATEELRRHPDALGLLLVRPDAAPPARQTALLEAGARVGGAAAAPPLLALVRAGDRAGSLRVAAARALLTVDPAAGVTAVAELLRAPGPVPDLYLLVHLAAATGRADAVPLLVDALRANTDRSVRCHAATGLGAFREPIAVDALVVAATGDEYPAVRVNALRALARAAAPDRLRDVAAAVAASDADPGVRSVAREVAPPANR